MNLAQKSVSERLKEVVTTQLGVTPERVTSQARIVDDLGADKLAVVILFMAIEEEFRIDIPDSESMKVVTIADAIKAIEHRIRLS